MGLIKKCDVKHHFAARRRARALRQPPTSQPDGTGFSVTETNETEARISDFAEDFRLEHSAAIISIKQTNHLTGFSGTQAPAIPGNPQA
jgi:hypothetical protein